MTLAVLDLGAGDAPERPLGHARECCCTWEASQCLNAKGRPFRAIGKGPLAGRWVAYCCCGGCEFDMTLFGGAA